MLVVELVGLDVAEDAWNAFECRVADLEVEQVQQATALLTHIAVLVHLDLVVVAQDGRDEEVHLEARQVVRADGRIPARGVHAQGLLHAGRDALHVVRVHVLLLHLRLGHEVPDDDQPIPVSRDHHVFQAVAKFQPADFVLVPRQDVTSLRFLITDSYRLIVTDTDDDVVLMRGEFGVECAVVVGVDVSEVLVVGRVEEPQLAVTGAREQYVLVGLHGAELDPLHTLAVVVRGYD